MSAPWGDPFWEQNSTEVRIADAAIEVIAEQGFDIFSVRTVAAVAGIAPGTLQYHYATRQALLVGALKRTGARQLIRIRAYRTHPSPHGQLAAALEQLLPLDKARNQECALWLALGAAAASRSYLQTAYLEGLELFHGHLTDYLERSDLALSMNPAVAARLLSALVNGLTLDWMSLDLANRAERRTDFYAGLALILGRPAS